ncbi:hypothetical protein SUGI_0067020 [Cryptomeria japonica]|uniref:1-phosphatidylinositol-3-phosphate 5-kinase FAB1A-like n=1 Tax=Cryptomeria japonica TaxID=3369 RepID=UPI002408A61C|nr:1-phosphatidylinositol-3-phosphate 5-kinase FAB1A-like [Cryptomeria japonica]GLJ07433.1 hypothetical protein SUGI_0067020 [Cryptomeria japonica]
MAAEEPSLELLKENQERAENKMISKKFDERNAECRNQEQVLSKEDFPPSPSDHQSILVSLSSRSVLKGTLCMPSRLFDMYYGSFAKTLGEYLRDDLFCQKPRLCCGEPSEAHVLCYRHRQGSLTVSVKREPPMLTLAGEREGKIWMWHRCCTGKDGVPQDTQIVVMSDAALRSSFGKFLELSFSNHGAGTGSRVAICGHSLHRDCLRFFGFGSMTACFQYSSINVLSVYLPPSKLEFNDPNQQEWPRKEANEVADEVELFYAEVLYLLIQIGEKIGSSGSMYTGTKVSESRRQAAELEGLLQMQKAAIEEILQRAIPNDWQPGKPVADVLELNRLRRYLLCLSYSWDRQLWDLYSSLTTKDVRIESNQDKADMSGTLHNIVIQSGDGNAIHDGLVQPAMTNNFHRSFGNKLKESSSMNGELDDGVNTFEVAVNRVTPDGDDMESPDHSREICPLLRLLADRAQMIQRAIMEWLQVQREIFDSWRILLIEWTQHGQSSSVQAMPVTSQVLDIAPVNGSIVACGGEPAVTKDFQPFQQTATGVKTRCDSILNGQDKGGMEVSDTSKSFKGTVSGSIRLDSLIDYRPKFVSMFSLGGGRLVLPSGVNNTIIAVYDDEPTSIISYALSSHEYQASLYGDNGPDNEEQKEKDRDKEKEYAELLGMPIGISYPISSSDSSSDSVDFQRHVKVSFTDEGPHGKTKYTVTCFFAREFDALRRECCPTEIDFRPSLSRCKKWEAQGGKSKVSFAKSLDDRFVIKQVKRTELDSFIKFAPAYFKYLTDSLSCGSSTCLAKILGIYQVMKHAKDGREIRMDLLVMENLLYGRNVTRVYDLKGFAHSRYNSDPTGSNKVLWDQNLLETMPTDPIFLCENAKLLLEEAVGNDSSFLASIDVMDYSLLVGVDEERCELVLGIIDFIRQYTWDKYLETWVKSSGILGGPINTSPTVIPPKQYEERFRKAMSHYFPMVPDQCHPPAFSFTI